MRRSLSAIANIRKFMEMIKTDRQKAMVILMEYATDCINELLRNNPEKITSRHVEVMNAATALWNYEADEFLHSLEYLQHRIENINCDTDDLLMTTAKKETENMITDLKKSIEEMKKIEK